MFNGEQRTGLWANKKSGVAKTEILTYEDSCAIVIKGGQRPRDIDVRSGDRRLDDISSADYSSSAEIGTLLTSLRQVDGRSR